MAPHSSILAWKIPWTEEPGRLLSMGSLGVGQAWAASLWLFTFMHWRRKWQPTPVFLPGESQGWRSLVGCHLWGHTGSTWLKWLSSSSSSKVHLVKAMVFPVVMYNVRVGLWRKLSAKELMLLNCGVGEDSWESLGLQGDPTTPS